MPTIIRKIAIALLLGLAGVLTASAGQYYDLALKAFDSGDYERCIELFEKKIPAEIKQEKKERIFNTYSWWPYVESSFAIKDFNRAFHGITDNHRIINKKYWIDDRWWHLTPSDLRLWPKAKKPLLDVVLNEFAWYYSRNYDAFIKSPIVKYLADIGYMNGAALTVYASELFWKQSLTLINAGLTETEGYAFDYLIRAADFGHMVAAEAVANAYETGKLELSDGSSIAVVRDMARSLGYWEKLADAGAAQTDTELYPSYKCAEIYQYNDTIRNLPKAISYFDRVILSEVNAPFLKSAAHKNRAQCYMEMGDTVAFFNKNREAFEAGYNSVAHNLGNCYKNGWGTGIDFDKAFEAYSAGMEAQNVLSPVVPCQWETGMLLRDGKGCAADPERALELFKAASDAGLIFAQYTLAEEYYNRQQWSDAMTLCQTVAERDDSIPDAARASVCKKIASMYTHGRGVEPDEAAAKLWWDRAASYGDDDAGLISRWLGQKQ